MTSEGKQYSTTAEPKMNASNPSENNTDNFELKAGVIIYISVISSIEIPSICLAIYAVYSLIKSKHAAPVFVMNLLISNLILIVGMLLYISPFKLIRIISKTTIMWAGFTGLYFMTCTAIERYVLIGHPVWHRSHCSVKYFVCTSLTDWLVSFITFPIIYLTNVLIFLMSFIFYPVIIVCFVGSCRSLYHSISLTPLKKQIVLAPLFFVVISYTFLILPVNILFIVHKKIGNSVNHLKDFTSSLYVLNPLVDCLLYVFMRSDAEKIIRTPHCCSRLKKVQTEMGQTICRPSTDVQRDHV